MSYPNTETEAKFTEGYKLGKLNPDLADPTGIIQDLDWVQGFKQGQKETKRLKAVNAPKVRTTGFYEKQ